jgi:chromosome partitioning protein
MIITIVNQKGGSGKTSTTILIGLGLAARGKKVLLVDCDPQAGLTAFLLPWQKERSGIFELIIGKHVEPIDLNRSGLLFDLIPADHRLDKVYTTLSPYEFKKISFIKPYDYIIFDTPPTVQGISRSAAMVADKIIIPADVSRATIYPTLYTINVLKEIEKNAKVVLLGKNYDDTATGFLAEVTQEFKKLLGKHYSGFIPRNITMQKAISNNTQQWPQAKITKLLNPVLDAVKL